MFSFFGIEQKEAPQVATSPQDDNQPNHGLSSQGQSSLFGGMDVQSQEGQSESGSGFSFIAEPEVSSSAFSFIQPTIEAQSEDRSGFAFLSEDASATSELVASSFSFMSNTIVDRRDEVSNVAAPPVRTLIESVVTTAKTELQNTSNIEPIEAGVNAISHAQAAEAEPTMRLARSSLNKQAIKKKRAAKVGFGREEDEDEKKLGGVTAGTVDITPPVAQAACLPNQSSLPTVPTGGRGEEWGKRLTVETAYTPVVEPAISSIPLNILAAMASAPQPIPAFSPAQPEHGLVQPALPPPDLSAVAVEVPTSVPTGTPSTPPPPVPQPAIEAHPSPGLCPAVTAEGALRSPYTNGVQPVQPQPVRSSHSSAQFSPLETPVQKLERRSREALGQIGRALADLSHLHSAALEGQLRFKREIEAESARLDAARAAKESTELEQARLAQEEDFESADALNAALERIAADILRGEAELQSLRGSVRMLEETFAQERAEIVDGLARAAASLKTTKEQLELGASQLERAAEKQFVAEQARIAAELERIGLEKSHFEREEQALSEDTARTEDAIQSQTGDLDERRSALDACIVEVDSDIEALQQQLAAKLAEKAQLSADLEEVESKIGEVRKKYDRQLQRISDRRSALLQSKQECLEEESAVLRDRGALEESTAKEQDAASALRAWTQRLQCNSAVLDGLLRSLTPTGVSDLNKSSISIAVISTANDGEGGIGTESLRKNLDAIVFLSAKKAAFVAEVTARRDELLAESRRLGESIPLLDAEKKAHATSKRFKEAAAVAKDLKEQQAAKEAADAELASAEADIAHLQGDLNELATQESQTRAALEEAQKLVDATIFEQLVERAWTVHLLLELSAGQGDASEVHGDHALFTALNSFLSRELESVLREAKEIQARHGFSASVEDILAERASAASGASGVSEGAAAAEGGVEDGPGREESAAVQGDVALGGDHSEAETAEADSSRDLEGDADGTGDGAAAEGEWDPAEVPGTPQDSDPALTEDEAAEERGQVCNRADEIARAKAMVAQLSELGAEMDEASDREDYEKAAELFEAITTCTAQLDQVLNALGCTRDELMRENNVHYN